MKQKCFVFKKKVTESHHCLPPSSTSLPSKYEVPRFCLTCIIFISTTIKLGNGFGKSSLLPHRRVFYLGGKLL